MYRCNPGAYRPSRASEQLVFGAAQHSVFWRFAFMCQSGNFSEALVGVSSRQSKQFFSLQRFFTGSIWCQGQPYKAKTDSFYFNVTFQEDISTFVISRTERGCRQT